MVKVKMSYKSPSLHRSRSRLRVFESIVQDQGNPRVPIIETRNLEVRGSSFWLPFEITLQQLFEEYGPMHVFDTQRIAQSTVIVCYFDIRHAVKAFFALRRLFEVRFLPDPNEASFVDYVTVYNENNYPTDFISTVLQKYGEIRHIREIGKVLIAHFYDLRSARDAIAELASYEPSQGTSDSQDPAASLSCEDAKQAPTITVDFFENVFLDKSLASPMELNTSPSSDSTAPSPFVNPSSPRSNESPGDNSRKRDEDVSYYVINLEAVGLGTDSRTTVMIKNIPNKYTQKMLLQTLDRKFSNTYDFFYLPIDFKNKCNMGYAFINFVDFSVIPDFFQEFNAKKWERFNSEKICALAYARIQGRNALLQHFQNASVMQHADNKVKPLILHSK